MKRFLARWSNGPGPKRPWARVRLGAFPDSMGEGVTYHQALMDLDAKLVSEMASAQRLYERLIEARSQLAQEMASNNPLDLGPLGEAS